MAKAYVHMAAAVVNVSVAIGLCLKLFKLLTKQGQNNAEEKRTELSIKALRKARNRPLCTTAQGVREHLIRMAA